MESNKLIFARNLQKYMDEKRKTRSDVCHDLGFKYSTFTEWVNGVKYPRIDKIELLANYFGIEKSDLIEDKRSNFFSNLIIHSEQEQPAPKSELSEDESMLLDLFRSLPEDERKSVLLLLRRAAGRS